MLILVALSQWILSIKYVPCFSFLHFLPLTCISDWFLEYRGHGLHSSAQICGICYTPTPICAWFEGNLSEIVIWISGEMA